jgi:hypothetical protein
MPIAQPKPVFDDVAPWLERWLRVVDAPSYEVSNLGRVRNVATGHILRPRIHSHGYHRIAIGAAREEYIHRLVCTAFNGPCPDGFQCDHINRDRSDNRAQNLRWVTPEENKAHRFIPQGEDRTQSKLTQAEVEMIRTLLPALSNTAIGARFGVHRRTIADIRNGVTWK